MNLTEEKKTPLRQKKLDEKREMLAMRFKGSIQVDRCCSNVLGRCRGTSL